MNFFPYVAHRLVRVCLNATVWGLIFSVLALSAVYHSLALPVADDFCRAGLQLEPGGWIDFVREKYLTWTGRWFAMAIYGLAFPRIDMVSWQYPLLVVLSPLMWMASVSLALKMIWPHRLGLAENWSVVALATAVYWCMMPSQGQTWYWLTGMVEYHLPQLLAVIALYLAATGAIWRSAPAALLALVVPALNELIALFLIGTLIMVIFGALVQQRKQIVLRLLPVITLAVIGLIVVLQAPGNDIRLAQDFPDAHTLMGTLWGFTKDPEQSPVGWLSNTAPWAVGLLVLARFGYTAPQGSWQSEKCGAPGLPVSLLTAAVVAGLLAVFLGRFVMAYGTGAPMTGRVNDTLFSAFVLGGFVVLSAVAAQGGGAWLRTSPQSTGVMAAAVFAMVFGVFEAQNTKAALKDVGRTGSEWHPSVTNRAAQLAKIQNGSDPAVVRLAPIDWHPNAFFWRELSEDPSHWRNRCIADYFGVASVQVEKH
ncbi:DUF6056 family protein [uncultured Roseobacter sp.]|uniref:DUF6056 family protein n=1 Tax=uncultured Roseobacter sp. TaxID=114847 RepID=UPI00262FA7D3|nr:DUF6056 family protein [uncultured Roseobacter sp.]